MGRKVIVMIGMIAMIMGGVVLLNSQLSAEEAFGQSIFNNIETPHPYEAPVSKTLIWSKTIDQPGATWIKIHFCQFQLNPYDYVNLRDMNGRLIDQIYGKNIAREVNSRFKVKKNDDNTFSFWGPTIDGDKIIIELYARPNENKAFGFSIDEIGIGTTSIYEKGLEPNNKNNGENGNSFMEKNDQLNKMINPGNSTEKIGNMLYKIGTSWYICKGVLLDGSSNKFLLSKACIELLEVIDTIEVRFYCPCKKNESPFHKSFFVNKIKSGTSQFELDLLVLKRKNYKKVDGF